jgi:ubiquinone/menaquinone biosynthesis C-methylase UbiE
MITIVYLTAAKLQLPTLTNPTPRLHVLTLSPSTKTAKSLLNCRYSWAVWWSGRVMSAPGVESLVGFLVSFCASYYEAIRRSAAIPAEEDVMPEVAISDQRGGDVTLFTELDLTPDARFFVEFMDLASALPDKQRLKSVTAERLGLVPGARVLDVGCGTGDDARTLASVVGPGGHVAGIDASATMIEVAKERSADSVLPVEFALGDACSLGFSDSVFDACRCVTVLMHVEGDPAAAIAEMVRVTRPGGRVVVADFHKDALVIDHPDRARTRQIVHIVCDAFRHGWIGSQLPRLMTNAGLTGVQIEGHTIQTPYPMIRHTLNGPLAHALQQGHLDEADVTHWWRPLEEAELRNQFMATFLTFIVTGTVPA